MSMEGVFALLILAIFFTSLIALVYPLPKIGLTTRRRAGSIFVLSLALMMVFDTVFGNGSVGGRTHRECSWSVDTVVVDRPPGDSQPKDAR